MRLLRKGNTKIQDGVSFSHLSTISDSALRNQRKPTEYISVHVTQLNMLKSFSEILVLCCIQCPNRSTRTDILNFSPS